MKLHRLAALLGLLATPAVAGELPGVFTPLPQPAGAARLLRPPSAPGAPLVIILPDALGEDGRAEPYVDSLLARGIGTLLLGLGEGRDAPDVPEVDPAASPEALAVARAWIFSQSQPPHRIGVMGFGLGARAVLAGAIEEPVAALYPRCAMLPVPATPRALILQGEDAAEGCEQLRLPEGAEMRLLRGAGHGWDAPGAIWPSTGPLLPDPAGGPRVRATMDPGVTLTAAEMVADWFEDLLFGRSQRAGH